MNGDHIDTSIEGGAPSRREALAEREARLSELAEQVLATAATVVSSEQERARVFAMLADDAAVKAVLEEERSRLAAEVERLESQLAESTASSEITLPAEERATPDASSHLVFFPVAGRGYVLVERPGAAPTAGDIVDLAAHGGPATASVTKIGAAPVPGIELSCAYVL